MKLSEAIAALERGEEVEFSRDDEWLTFSENTRFDLIAAKSHKFRIKPKPITLWVNFHPDRMFVHVSKEIAEREAGPSALGIAVPFREAAPLTEEERSKLSRIKKFWRQHPSWDITFLLDLLKKQGVE